LVFDEINLPEVGNVDPFKQDVVCEADIPAIVMAIESKQVQMISVNQVEDREDVKLVR
jgi:hypothetical protein